MKINIKFDYEIANDTFCYFIKDKELCEFSLELDCIHLVIQNIYSGNREKRSVIVDSNKFNVLSK